MAFMPLCEKLSHERVESGRSQLLGFLKEASELTLSKSNPTLCHTTIILTT